MYRAVTLRYNCSLEHEYEYAHLQMIPGLNLTVSNGFIKPLLLMVIFFAFFTPIFQREKRTSIISLFVELLWDVCMVHDG